jgi:carboxypeptidase C (cathepsin A)
MRLAGRTLDYTATVGTLPVRDAKGKVIADVVFTAYTMPGKDRPVTFALNGGPGASSVYLNMGAIGPKVVTFGRGRQRLGAGHPARQPGHLAGLHRPGVHRSGRHRFQPRADRRR